MHEIADPSECFEVFVHLAAEAGPSEIAILDALGVRGAVSGRCVLTGTLSARGVEELSDKPWIRQLRLSRRLRPLIGI